MEKIQKLKNIIEKKIYLYQSDMTQTVPVDDNGNVRTEYISYVALNTMHNLIESVSRDIAHITIKGPRGDEDFAEVDTSTSFYAISRETMDEIMEIMDSDEDLNDQDFDPDARDTMDDRDFTA